jgi:hypothetical protein
MVGTTRWPLSWTHPTRWRVTPQRDTNGVPPRIYPRPTVLRLYPQIRVQFATDAVEASFLRIPKFAILCQVEQYRYLLLNCGSFRRKAQDVKNLLLHGSWRNLSVMHN